MNQAIEYVDGYLEFRRLMSLSAARWRRASRSGFSWERDVLQFPADHLRDLEPVRVWSNFELAPHARRDNVRLPFIETLVFCSVAGLDLDLRA